MLLVWAEKAVRGFARYHKYTVGTQIRQQAMLVCRGVLRAQACSGAARLHDLSHRLQGWPCNSRPAKGSKTHWPCLCAPGSATPGTGLDSFYQRAASVLFLPGRTVGCQAIGMACASVRWWLCTRLQFDCMFFDVSTFY